MILPLREEAPENLPEKAPEADWSPVADALEDGLDIEPWKAEGAVWSEWDGAVPVDAATYPIKKEMRKGQGGAKPASDYDADAYWKSLDAKVRNQVRKAEKSGVTVLWGREERLDEF